MVTRPKFEDKGQHWRDFSTFCLAECPRCRGQCQIRGSWDSHDALWRLTCTHCGHVKELFPSSFTDDGRAVDPIFGLPLWLSTPCCGKTLWAFNPEHLAFIENYVRAELRVAADKIDDQIRNKTFASRLPQWMILAHHRDDVLRGVERLRKRLLEAS